MIVNGNCSGFWNYMIGWNYNLSRVEKENSKECVVECGVVRIRNMDSDSNRADVGPGSVSKWVSV